MTTWGGGTRITREKMEKGIRKRPKGEHGNGGPVMVVLVRG